MAVTDFSFDDYRVELELELERLTDMAGSLTKLLTRPSPYESELQQWLDDTRRNIHTVRAALKRLAKTKKAPPLTTVMERFAMVGSFGS